MYVAENQLDVANSSEGLNSRSSSVLLMGTMGRKQNKTIEKQTRSIISSLTQQSPMGMDKVPPHACNATHFEYRGIAPGMIAGKIQFERHARNQIPGSASCMAAEVRSKRRSKISGKNFNP
jgi:hypothetical protein